MFITDTANFAAVEKFTETLPGDRDTVGLARTQGTAFRVAVAVVE